MSLYKQEKPPQKGPNSPRSHMAKSRNEIIPPISEKYMTDAAASGPLSSEHHNPAVISRQTSAPYDAEEGLRYHVDVESDTEINNETMMATKISDNGMMGCAFFSTRDGRLSVAQDVPFVDAPLLHRFLEHIQPMSILIPENFPNGLAEILDSYVDRSYQGKSLENTTTLGYANIGTEEATQRSHITALENSEFSTSVSRDRLLKTFSNLENETRAIFHLQQSHKSKNKTIGGTPSDGESTDMQCIRLSANLGSKNSESIACAGVIVAAVNKRRASQSQHDIGLAQTMYGIQSIEQFHLLDHLYINPAAMSSLQILHCEMHPNSHTWHTNSGVAKKKEGLSVYGMFHHLASTSQGRVQLRKLFMRPSTDISTITARHQAISTLLQPKNSEILTQTASALQKVPDMKGIISKLSKGINCASMGHSSRGGLWASLEKFSTNVVEVKRLAESFAGCDSAPILEKFRDSVDVGAIACVGSLIKRTVDFEQSMLRERFSIHSGVDTDLDLLKRRYDGMESLLTEVVNNIIADSAAWARQYIKSCIFLPQLGFLLVVDLDESTGNGKYCGEGQSLDVWEKIFTADGSVCYKTRQMQELDEAYGDIYCQIGDREVEILHKLASSVLEYSSELVLASQLCGELDAILALALGAQKYGWNQPEMNRNGGTYIAGGRHPLHEASMQHFISNDFGAPVETDEARQKLGRVLIVTGPNHSGKSVYLKQVALIVYLAHIGSFVPADKAEIAITDKILVCMPTQESASTNESAFATDLREVSHLAKQATEKSLVVVDEFGKGTCPVNGAGLAAGLLNHFLSLRHENCPQVIMATHFHEIFEFENLSSNESPNFAHMKAEINHGKLVNGNDPLTYLFTLQRGRSSSSFGEQCATMNGVPDAVVNRAGAISSIIDRDGDLATTCATLTHAEQARLEIAEEVARSFISYELRLWEYSEPVSEAVEMLANLLS
ncbi:hypothetical protein LLEC1_00101 [Akanthomyces lecanii]|uniref:DNA mismatch repair proteins mutS family domain-containing protein n=1 Tax=Cordyceps confragosa TaxID=2714763 RepID=A0A179IKE0_CORDF|nr:hypothetical protein LLEC1_00101 [Akanthomyces lecanii]